MAKVNVSDIVQLATKLNASGLTDVFVEIASSRIIFKEASASFTIFTWDETDDEPITKPPPLFQKVGIQTDATGTGGVVYDKIITTEQLLLD